MAFIAVFRDENKTEMLKVPIPMSVDDWYCEQYGEMHNIQFVTKEVLLADLELFHSTWYFLMTMDISRYPNNIFIKILKQFWRKIQKSLFWLKIVFFQE